MLPWFVAKMTVSYFSGAMLNRWCPETVSVNGTSVPLQQAMINNQVDYWHSPAAMWLLLGGWALAGCILALLLRGWLTRGAHWKVDTHDSETPATATPPAVPKSAAKPEAEEELIRK
jgi:hypothetical protein